jgi:hypothetical protein
MDRFRKCAYELKKRNLEGLIVSVPAHTEENLVYGAKMREPTMEEISMMSYLALAYGANGVLQFSFESKGFKNSAGKKYYYWGILDTSVYVHPCDEKSGNRIKNYYGQDKWNELVKLNSALRKTGDFIYSNPGGALVYEDTRTVNSKFGNENESEAWGLPYSYIQGIKSYPYDKSTGKYNENNPDPAEKSYWEIGFFNPRASEPNGKSKYFLVVNKRCATGDKETGDYRLLKIKFDFSKLPDTGNWVIKDALTGNILAEVNANSGFVTAAEFKPGEGRLFVLAPR